MPILALLAGGCQEFLPAPPLVSRMVPATAVEGEEVEVTIGGANFFLDVLISYRDENNSHIRADFSARLGETELLEVTYVDSATLTARVPATLAPGEYDLTVEDPLGRTGRLANAFRVDRLIECQQDLDCQDPCYSSAACVDNRCVMGEVVKDSDSDGFIDRACPGGDDCDDDPAGCGADCHPGLTDDCDGYDNDCDDSTDEDFTPATTCGVGVCRAEETCSGQAGASCTENPPDEASDLTCDGLDGDCDGDTDEDYLSSPITCGTGVCLASGQTDCQAGAEVDICVAGPQNEPSDVTCDGLDGDCDGLTDEEWTPAATCGFGVCQADEVCNGSTGVDCTPGAPDEPNEFSCSDNLDNDCDDMTDGADPSCGAPNTPPLPAILVSPSAGEAGTDFQASAVGTTDREQDPATLIYRWDWANDGTFEDAGQVVNRTLATAGVYTVVLEVEDAGSLRAYHSFVLHVLETDALLVVTTPEDEEDAGAAPGPDFSLREAIAYANGLAGHQQILVPDGYVINLTLGTLGNFTDAEGVSIIGDGAVLDGLGGGTNCVQINGSNNKLFGLEIRNCPDYAVVVQGGSGNQISRCHLHHSDDGIYFISPANDFGPDNLVADNTTWGLYTVAAINVVGNRFRDNGSVGVRLVSAAGTYLRQNVIFRNGVGIEMGTSCSNSIFYHNTVHGSLGNGMYVFNNIVNLDFRNNIISSSGNWAIDGKDSNFGHIDYNDFYANTTGICSSCSPGSNDITDDPLYIDPATDDLRLQPTSTLINTGTDLGLDVNGPQAGNFNGSAPDRGYWEWP